MADPEGVGAEVGLDEQGVPADGRAGRLAAGRPARVDVVHGLLGVLGQQPEDVLGLLAQDAQEVVQAADPGWPACREPSCPEVGTHPLHVEPDLGPDPFWVCHRTGLPVAAVGGLNG